MLKFKWLFLSIIGMFFLWQAHAQSVKDAKRFYVEKWKFSTIKPVNWQVKENPTASILASFTDKSGATIDILLEEKTGESNVESYFKKNLDVLKDSEDTKVGKNGKVTVNGIPAHWIIHTDQNSESQTLDYYFLQNGTGFIISSTIKSASFTNYEKTFRQIAESFRFEKEK